MSIEAYNHFRSLLVDLLHTVEEERDVAAVLASQNLSEFDKGQEIAYDNIIRELEGIMAEAPEFSQEPQA